MDIRFVTYMGSGSGSYTPRVILGKSPSLSESEGDGNKWTGCLLTLTVRILQCGYVFILRHSTLNHVIKR